MFIHTLRYVDLEEFGFSFSTYDKLQDMGCDCDNGFLTLSHVNEYIKRLPNYDGEYLTGDKDKAAHIKLLNLMVEDGEVEVQVWS